LSPLTRKVLVVDDHPIVREGITLLLTAQHDLRVCGSAFDIPSALQAVRDLQPDVALVVGTRHLVHQFDEARRRPRFGAEQMGAAGQARQYDEFQEPVAKFRISAAVHAGVPQVSVKPR